MKYTLKKLITVVVAVGLLLPLTANATIGNDLDKYFNDLGLSSNTTMPHAYHGQEAGYYTGGSMSLRTNVRDIQVVQLNYPSIRSGCGGIDIFGGSLSFMDKDELKKTLHNILNSGGVYAFTLALETASPMIENVMNKWNDFRNKLNQASINSCETAEALVGGAWPKVRGAKERICEDIGSGTGYFDDWTRARQGCGSGGEYDSVLERAKNHPDYNKYKDMVVDNQNIVWKAIKHRDFLANDDDLAELFMSLSGTVVLYNDKQGMRHRTYPALAEDKKVVKALLSGGKATIYRCNTTDTDGCLNPETNHVMNVSKDTAFKSRVAKLLRDIADKIIKDKPLSAAEISLIQSTNIPVFKILSVQIVYMKNGSLSNIDAYAEVIAMDILYRYLNETLSIIKSSIATLQLPDGIVNEIEPNIDRQMRLLSEARVTAYKQLAITDQMIQQTQTMERMIAGSLSNEFANKLSWAKGLR